MQKIPEFSQLHLMVLSEKRGGQPETEIHSLGPAMQGCELTYTEMHNLLILLQEWELQYWLVHDIGAKNWCFALQKI